MSSNGTEVSFEHVETVLEKWAENLWMLNNRARITDEASKQLSIKEFLHNFYPDNDRNLTKAQRISEQGFFLFCQGVSYSVGLVSEKAADTLCGNRLVDAWRKSVLRNGSQQKYSRFEAILKETLDASGVDAAVAQFPYAYARSGVAEALESMHYDTKQLDPWLVADLIRRAQTCPPVGLAPKTP